MPKQARNYREERDSARAEVEDLKRSISEADGIVAEQREEIEQLVADKIAYQDNSAELSYNLSLAQAELATAHATIEAFSSARAAERARSVAPRYNPVMQPLVLRVTGKNGDALTGELQIGESVYAVVPEAKSTGKLGVKTSVGEPLFGLNAEGQWVSAMPKADAAKLAKSLEEAV